MAIGAFSGSIWDRGKDQPFRSCAVRPEKIAISAEEPLDRANRVQGKILDIGYLGNLSTYHVELPEGPVIKCEVGNRSRIERRDFTWEDEVWLSWSDTAGLVLAK